MSRALIIIGVLAGIAALWAVLTSWISEAFIVVVIYLVIAANIIDMGRKR